MDNRLAELERRIAALESGASTRRRPQAAGFPQTDDSAPVGRALLASNGVEPAVLDADWTEWAGALAALGNPVRLTLLQQILRGTSTVNALSEVQGLGTSGQIYHHLRQLTAEGWLHTPSRGVFAVPPPRVVALMTILAALEGRA
ncbi:winged helix-turn-helix transcriptional regulator [Kribbella qitaiheensis]|uniref:Winged helix-turn-helix transcriptional regulator n=1 Tax=Kribbella qitaiheensis TaxID=1544730 RepID=A0A7G6XA59_9ACTN|nr:winged helix-turn-helix transcriptional regulator [Kribbella qitaiheensis]